VDDRYRSFGGGKAGVWMTAVLDSQRGLNQWVDGWSIHPYPRDHRVPATKQAADSVAQVKNLHNQLAGRNLTGKIWITEIGFHGRPSTFNASDSQATASASYKTLVQAAGAMGGANPVTAVYAFTSAREAVIPNEKAGDFGYNLFGFDGRVMPVLAAFAQSTTVQSATKVAPRK
ncbi:MAG TPA: hypothetical protein VF657_14935, partial [Actinoplanes sp.]